MPGGVDLENRVLSDKIMKVCAEHCVLGRGRRSEQLYQPYRDKDEDWPGF